MKGWGAQDDFQEQIAATINDRIAAARAQLEGQGQTHCDCGEEIPLLRRQALPNTTRCIKCQIRFERSE